MLNKQILVIGDLHLGVNKNNSTFIQSALNYADWIVDICKQNNITQIVQLGDIFHHDNVLHISALNGAYKFFEKLKTFDLHVVVGNHDVPYKNTTEVHSLQLLSNWPNITIHDKITTLGNITFCGWASKLEDIPFNQKIIFGHFDIRGFEMSAGKLSEHGFSGSDLMDRCELLMSGHYHKPQIRMFNKKPLIYSGSCFQLNWGESGEDKFAYILDTETLKINKIENTISPKFVYIKSKNDKNKIKNNFVAIECDNHDYDNIVKHMIANNALDVKQINKASGSSIGTEEIENFKGVSINDVIDEYVDLIVGLSDDEKKLLATESKMLYDSCL